MRIILLVMSDGAGRRYNVGAVAGDAQPVDGGDPADIMDLVARTGALTVHEVRAVADANLGEFAEVRP